jgi:hypothetical protein
MAVRKRATDTSQAQPETDRKGFVHIKKGDQDARIVPESWPVWENEGWSLVDGGSPKEERPVEDEGK